METKLSANNTSNHKDPCLLGAFLLIAATFRANTGLWHCKSTYIFIAAVAQLVKRRWKKIKIISRSQQFISQSVMSPFSNLNKATSREKQKASSLLVEYIQHVPCRRHIQLRWAVKNNAPDRDNWRADWKRLRPTHCELINARVSPTETCSFCRTSP